LGNEAECRRLLFDSLEHRTLPMFERVMNDPQLAAVRNADWFAEFVRLRLSKADWKVFTM
jgi:hypothetical protein